MLSFLTRPEHIRFFEGFRKKMDSSLVESIKIVEYGELVESRSWPAGTYVFTSLDQLSPSHRELAVTVAGQLRGSRCGVVNDPGRALGRADLLRRMSKIGVNRFSVYGLDDIPLNRVRYPVFVREARRHSGSLTGLLDSETELVREAEALVRLGYKRPDLLVVEFCDTRDQHGVFRKYSAMVVGGVAIPRYLDFSRHWVVKRSDTKLGGLLTDSGGPERVAEEMRYMTENPHKAWIERVAAEAHIQFGRLDYGALQGQPQLWEINTAPTFGSGRGHLDPGHRDIVRLRNPAKDLFYERFFRALGEITEKEPAVGTDGQRILINIPDALAVLVRAERRREAAVGKIRRVVNATSHRLKGPQYRRLRGLLSGLGTRLNRRLG